MPRVASSMIGLLARFEDPFDNRSDLGQTIWEVSHGERSSVDKRPMVV